MTEGVLVLHARDAGALATIRCQPGLKAARQGEQLWLRGIDLNEPAHPQLSQLPALHTYWLSKHLFLHQPGGKVPVAKLPALPWQPLTAFIPVEVPTALLPGQLAQHYQARLQPSAFAQPGSALLVSLPALQQYAHTAPATRLKPLQWVVFDAQPAQALLLGQPLPPLPGQELWQKGSLLLPAGYDFALGIMAELVQQLLAPAGDKLIVFDTESNWQAIDHGALVSCTRSSIRLTTEQQQHEQGQP